MADTLTLEVPPSLDGARVDKALATMLGISRAEARALLDRGVSIDGVRAKPRDRLSAGVTIETPIPEPHAGLQPEKIDFDILYGDETVLVVNKPPGVVVHPGSGRSKGTLASGLLHRYPDLKGVGVEGRWGLVHRLDKDTSGALLVARTQPAYERLISDLVARRIGRVYLTLVHRLFRVPTGTIEAPIGPDPARPTRRAVVATGKPAVTHYELVREYPQSQASLVQVRLETGRTHQIRVHMASIDHPVIGDHVYSNVVTSVSSPRVFLHAHRLEFTHPVTAELVTVEAPLPPDLSHVLATIESGTTGYPD